MSKQNLRQTRRHRNHAAVHSSRCCRPARGAAAAPPPAWLGLGVGVLLTSSLLSSPIVLLSSPPASSSLLISRESRFAPPWPWPASGAAAATDSDANGPGGGGGTGTTTGEDGDGALEKACHSLKGYEWDPNDLDFYFNQVELKMKDAAKKLDFEEAANLRDRIKRLRQKLVGQV